MSLPTRLRLFAAIFLLVLSAPQLAFAHAQLLGSEPAENALVETAPESVRLQFNEPVSPLTTKLIGPDGAALDLTGASVGGETLTVTLPADLGRGTQVLSWRVVSTDGHPVGGTLIFSIGEITGAAKVEASGDRMVAIALWLGKAVLYLCLFVGIGGALFGAVATLPGPARRVSLVSSGLGLVLAPLSMGLQGLDALALPLTAIGDANAWSTGFATSYGATTLVLGLAFAISIAALALPGKLAAVLGVLAGAVAALSLALSGHASAANPQLLTRPAVFLHIAGILFWLGALIPLWFWLRERSEPADKALAAFSKVIPFAVAPLVLSGLVLALIQMGLPGPAWLTPYGGILASKLALLAVLFGLAIWNRMGLTAPALAGNAMARYRLRRSIVIEMILVVIILGLVAGWRFTPPPRAIAAAPAVVAEPLMEHLIDGQTMVMLTLTPGQAGPVDAEIFVGDLTHAPKDATAVSLILSAPELGIEPIRRDAVEADGLWRVEGLTIPVAGTWQVETEVRLSRFELARPRAEITIP